MDAISYMEVIIWDTGSWLEPSEEGGYTVYVPALPGCISEGDTIEQALQNIREAIALYLKPLQGPPVQERQ
ncbi:MAG: hypothetical protein KatS3mg017_0389 [Fimbriimonadales bacterium]|nr:MAG: hypothetical protein KatS3mg017_0389 [Fimbriimonadales bacterium]